MAAFTALYDASVLYPAPLRDLLMHLAITGLFRARWTQRIHHEWIDNLLHNRPDLTRERLERTRELMNQAVLDCLVEGYEDLIESLVLPDPDDRHVLAAAIRVGVDVIVTSNVRDFPGQALRQYGVEAQKPDEFVQYLIDLAPVKVCAAVRQHRQSLTNPPKTIEEYLATLERQSLVGAVNMLRGYMELL